MHPLKVNLQKYQLALATAIVTRKMKDKISQYNRSENCKSLIAKKNAILKCRVHHARVKELNFNK